MKGTGPTHRRVAARTLRLMRAALLARLVPVQGVQFRNIEARRYQDQFTGKVRVDHNSNFQSVQQDGERLRIEFSFTTSYGAIGMIKVDGSLAWSGDVEAALAHWNEKRALPPAVAQEVHGAVLGACVPEAVLLARDLRLPPPMPIPQVKMQGKPGEGALAPASPAPHDAPDAH